MTVMWLAALLTLLINPALSAGPGYRVVDSIFLPPKFYVGDKVELRLTLEVTPTTQVIEPQKLPQRNWVSLDRVTVQSIGGSKVQVRVFFTPFSPGTMTLPPLSLGNVVLEGVKYNTLSVLEEGSSLRGLREPLYLPYTWPLFGALLLLLAGGPVLIMLVSRRLAVALRGIRERRRRTLPYLRFRRDLRKLLKGVQRLDSRQFFIALTQALKYYLGGRLTLPVLSCTTSELKARLRSFPIEDALVEQIVEVLDISDLVKFAGREASQHQISAVFEKVSAIGHSVEEVLGFVEP